MTAALERRFEALGSQEGDDAVVVAKFFTPDGGWSGFATEYSASDRLFFGLVQGLETELGYFSLDELERTPGPRGARIERDLHWKERTLREIRTALAAGQHV